MPKLSCWSCGRQIYTVAPLEALFAEERRCPRCGAFLRQERREAERRVSHQRENPPHDPGPPKPKGKPKGKTKTESTDSGERRVAERRTVRRRAGGSRRPAAGTDGSGGARG